MKAVVLAAGRGRRLGGAGEARPKCLHEVGGVSLLERMLRSLKELDVQEVILVVGFEEEQVRRRVAELPAEVVPPLTLISNQDYARGSVLSLWSARERFGEDDLIVMDADVLFPTVLLRRLVESSHPNAFLLDDRPQVMEGLSEEEMMLLTSEGRVERIARGLRPGSGKEAGEGVGFFRISRSDQQRLAEELLALVEAGSVDEEYETALDSLLSRIEAGFERISDLPWTEIDFPEDLERARAEILPQIAQLES